MRGRREREEQLQALRQHLRVAEPLLTDLGHGLCAFDRAGNYLHFGARLQSLCGVTATSLVGLPEPSCAEQVARALGGERCQARFWPASAPPRDLFLEARFYPFPDDGGEVAGVIATVHDRTAATHAEQRVLETEARFRNMADAAPVLLWMAGTDGLCTFFNQSWLDFTGRTFEEEWGVGWAELVHYEDLQRCLDTYQEAFSARRVFEMEYRLRRRDGEHRWLLDHGSPRYEATGAFAGYIGSCIDITERKRVVADLRKAVRDRDEFISVASHELRTPLSALHLQLDSMLSTLEKRPEEGLASGRLVKNARAAQRQGMRLSTLVSQLLDVSRIAGGRLILEREELDLSALVTEVSARFEEVSQQAGCTLAVSAPAPVTGRWDRLALEQVLSNLLTNAIKYGAGGRIEVSVHEQSGHACLSVRDHGIGISEDDRARIFGRFERAVSRRNYGGLGLGLWIARQTVEAHGGRISVDSAPGAGATFSVDLPLGGGSNGAPAGVESAVAT